MLLVGNHGNNAPGPALPMLLARPELAVAMETLCVATSIQLARVIICVCLCAMFLLMQEAMKSKHNWD